MPIDIRDRAGFDIYGERTKPFVALARGGPGRKILVVEQGTFGFFPLPYPNYWATHGLRLRPDDPYLQNDAKNQRYEPRIKDGTLVSRSLVNGTLLRGRSVPDTVTVPLINLDLGVPAPAGEIVGQETSVFLASDGWLHSDWRRLFLGVCTELTPAADGRSSTLTLESRQRYAQARIQSRRFTGFGHCIRSIAGTDHVDFGAGAAWLPTTKLCVEFLVDWHGGIAAGVRDLIGSGNATTGNWAVQCEKDAGNTARRIVFTIRDNGGTLHTVTSDYYPFVTSGPGYVGAFDSHRRVSCRWDGAQMKILIDGVEDPAATAFAGTPQANAALKLQWFILEGGGSGNRFNGGFITDVRIWKDVDRSTSEILDNAFRRLRATDVTGLVFYAKTREAIGTLTYDEIAQAVGTLSTSSMWNHTNTGSEELAGKPRPLCFGNVWHRDAVLTDQVNQVYEVHDATRYCRYIDSVFEGGNKLRGRPVETGATDISFDGTLKRITSVADFNFLPFAISQVVDITSTPYTGTGTITNVDEEEGRWIEVSEAIPTAAAGGLVQILPQFSGGYDWDWGYDPNVGAVVGTFQLFNVPTKPITARVRGEFTPAGDVYPDRTGAVMSAVWTDFLGRSAAEVSTSLAAVDAAYPYEMGYATGLEDEFADVVFDKLASGIGATWGFTVEDALLDLDVVTVPDPAATGDLLLSLTRNEIISMQRLSTAKPIRRAIVRYRQNFRVLSFDECVGLVQQDQTFYGARNLEWKTTANLYEEHGKEASNVVADAILAARKELDELLSYVVRAADAQAIAGAQYDLYSEKRDVFEVRVKLQPYNHEPRKTTVLVTNEDFSETALGKRFRPVAQKGGRTNVTLQVWG